MRFRAFSSCEFTRHQLRLSRCMPARRHSRSAGSWSALCGTVDGRVCLVWGRLLGVVGSPGAVHRSDGDRPSGQLLCGVRGVGAGVTAGGCPRLAGARLVACALGVGSAARSSGRGLADASSALPGAVRGSGHGSAGDRARVRGVGDGGAGACLARPSPEPRGTQRSLGVRDLHAAHVVTAGYADGVGCAVSVAIAGDVALFVAHDSGRLHTPQTGPGSIYSASEQINESRKRRTCACRAACQEAIGATTRAHGLPGGPGSSPREGASPGLPQLPHSPGSRPGGVQAPAPARERPRGAARDTHLRKPRTRHLLRSLRKCVSRAQQPGRGSRGAPGGIEPETTQGDAQRSPQRRVRAGVGATRT